MDHRWPLLTDVQNGKGFKEKKVFHWNFNLLTNVSGKQVFFSLLAKMTTWSRVNWFLRLTDDCSLIVTWLHFLNFCRQYLQPCHLGYLFLIWSGWKMALKSLLKCQVICKVPEKSSNARDQWEIGGGLVGKVVNIRYTVNLGIKFFFLLCDILRPQLAKNRFLPLWPHRFPHFGYIYLAGGVGFDIRLMSSIRPICKCRRPPLRIGSVVLIFQLLPSRRTSAEKDSLWCLSS